MLPAASAAGARTDDEEETREVNPQMASIKSTSSPLAMNSKKDSFGTPVSASTMFRVGVVISTLINVVEPSLAGISHPVSSCSVTSLTILQPMNADSNSASAAALADKWLRDHKLEKFADRVTVHWGDEGFQSILDSDDVDAIFLIVPTELQNKYVLAALDAGKHVLLKDQVSTSLTEFLEQLEHAVRLNKFLQFSTMFAHQYKVKKFLDCVLREQMFGRVTSIRATLHLSYADMGLVGVQLPLIQNQGCIRRLARYCVLFSVLLFTRVGSTATSVQIKKMERCESGASMSAEGVVHFTDNRTLTFDVAYRNISATRQHIEVQSDDRYASMNDFVFPNRDGLATYIVYERAKNQAGKSVVISGEAINMSSGPPQKVIMWKDFSDLSRRVDTSGGWYRSPETAEVRELALVAIQTKLILNALPASYNQGNKEIDISQDLALMKERFNHIVES